MKKLIAWLQARSDRRLRMKLVELHLQSKSVWDCKTEAVQKLFDYIKEG